MGRAVEQLSIDLASAALDSLSLSTASAPKNLPPELWRIIFLEATWCPNDPSTCLDDLYFLTHFQLWSYSLKADAVYKVRLRTKWAIVHTCRTWAQIGYELGFLYNDLLAGSIKSMPGLISALHQPHQGRNPDITHGCLMKHLDFSEFPARAGSLMSDLARTCPNLRSLKCNGPYMKDASEWTAFQRCIPELRSLKVLSLRFPNEAPQGEFSIPMELEQLEELSLSGLTSFRFVSQWKLPRLRVLGISKTSADAREILQSYGSQLTSLYIEYIPNFEPNLIPELCPNLTSFGCQSYVWASKIYMHRHPSIVTLAFRNMYFDSVSESSAVRAFLESVNLQRFPSLRYVRLLAEHEDCLQSAPKDVWDCWTPILDRWKTQGITLQDLYTNPITCTIEKRLEQNPWLSIVGGRHPPF
ncbi:hypothetical protein SISSUDRAFT_1035808 [Sistotremastrum suecicum HHB10207 ss-3]|uniref:F-box domain-containing protein n=1 Tax=Sistotremastrum suecicum HHB10207 ss-3 TaxID=1314776 RepID=A0A166A9M5_9AGAM|nr:hypothetical protein SISSUDRAFT_1035808 [Sistotremastrum suecicum HHB10207 ss-3]